jgi:hypothetical protein
MAYRRREVILMEEKVYKTMNGAGVLNIVMGVLALAAGIAGGVLLLISGAKLINNKSKILF